MTGVPHSFARMDMRAPTSLFAGKSLRNYAKELIMKRYLLLIGFIVAAVCSSLSGQDKIGLQSNATVLGILQGQRRQNCRVALEFWRENRRQGRTSYRQCRPSFSSDWRRIFRCLRRWERHFGSRDSNGRQIARASASAGCRCQDANLRMPSRADGVQCEAAKAAPDLDCQSSDRSKILAP